MGFICQQGRVAQALQLGCQTRSIGRPFCSEYYLTIIHCPSGCAQLWSNTGLLAGQSHSGFILKLGNDSWPPRFTLTHGYSMALLMASWWQRRSQDQQVPFSPPKKQVQRFRGILGEVASQTMSTMSMKHFLLAFHSADHLSEWHEISKPNKFLPENLGFAWMRMEKVPKIFCQMMVNDGDDFTMVESVKESTPKNKNPRNLDAQRLPSHWDCSFPRLIPSFPGSSKAVPNCYPRSAALWCGGKHAHPVDIPRFWLADQVSLKGLTYIFPMC